MQTYMQIIVCFVIIDRDYWNEKE